MKVKNHIKVSVSAVLIKDNKVLLGLRNGKSNPGFWEFPGGKLEYRESPLSAVVRETKEETNLDVKASKDLGYRNVLINDKHYLVLYYFVEMLNDSEDYNNNEPDKHSEFLWFDLDNLPSPLLDGVLSVIKSLELNK